jgi:hypothetical protein
MPRLPRLLPYVQRLNIETVPLTVWLSMNKRLCQSAQELTS